MRNLSLYIHIPFCKSKCSYCDFLSFAEERRTAWRDYAKALKSEIESYRGRCNAYNVSTIFFGGGTPSFVDGEIICEILELIRQVFHVDTGAEITLEGNPDSLTADKLSMYKEAGINRLSIGLQSARDDILKKLNRIHNYDQFVVAYNSAKRFGFDNINVDIMSGLPYDDTESFVKTLAKVVSHDPAHISSYGLMVEEGTPLSLNERLLNNLPDEDEERQMYKRTKLFLQRSGYERYEVSNYAKPGYHCRHNMVYWTGGEYLGLGLNSSSMLRVESNDECGIDNLTAVRFKNVTGLKEYMDIQAAKEGSVYSKSSYLHNAIDMELIKEFGYIEINPLSIWDEMEEMMFLGLRLTKGVSEEEFLGRFSLPMDEMYGEVINSYLDKGLLKRDKGYLSLTDEGFDVSNVIMADFLLDR